MCVCLSPLQNAASAVGEVSDLDWAVYKEKLPFLDVDALQANYEAFQKNIPAIPYDATADEAAHAEQVCGGTARVEGATCSGYACTLGVRPRLVCDIVLHCL